VALLGAALWGATVASWIEPQKKIFVNEIFGVDLRYLKSDRVSVSLQGGSNVRFIAAEPPKSGEIYETRRYYFKALAPSVRLPDAIVTAPTYRARAWGLQLQAHKLNPPPNFCGVLAKELSILSHESVQYNKERNLVVLRLEAQQGNLEDFALPFAIKQGIKEQNLSFPTSRIVYYAIIPANLEELRFSYFDTKSHEFRTLSAPVVVVDETVSTQSDIKPTEDKHKKIKVAIVFGLTILFVVLFFIKKSYLALLAALAFAALGAYLSIPIKKVCVKPGSRIYILPTKQSTIFEINRERKVYEELNRVGDYVKIKLSNQKVGWVKDEALCEN